MSHLSEQMKPELMKSKLKILHLEDSLADSELVHSIIKHGGIDHDYFLVENQKEYLNILATEKIDLILSDFSLPGYSGKEAMLVARDKYPEMPFIFVSGVLGENIAIEALLGGVTDYVLKNNLERLVPSIKRALHEFELETKHKQAETALIESERKYKELINEVNDGYFITDSQGIITFANNAMAKILGYSSPEELAGLSVTELIKSSNNTEFNNIFKNSVENKNMIDGLEIEILGPDRNSIYIEINAIPLLRDSDLIGMQGVIHEITERKLAEYNLIEKNKQIESQNEIYILINKELAFLLEEKQKSASELVIANIQKAAEEKYKLLIEEKNRDITNSINYAFRIQQAKLPRKEEIFASLPQCFILFKPKDIVSGDFYFFYKNHQTVFIAAADCTGHGVPGALMSMIGSEKLYEAFAQSSDTSEVLKLLNQGIKNSLRQSDSNESTRDGMDIAICSINPLDGKIVYAGANIPFWLIRNGTSDFEEIKGTRYAIGGLTDYNQLFESHALKLNKGDTFYLTTDGYAHQFDGTGSKKLSSIKFMEILLGIQELSMKDQEKYLDNYIETWRDKTEQVDDILVIGVRM